MPDQTFHPHMTTKIEGITFLEELRFRRWNTGITDLWHVQCAETSGGSYVSEAPRLVAILECAGDAQFCIRANKSHTGAGRGDQGCLFYIPAGMHVTSEVQGSCRLRHLDIHLDTQRLEQCLGYKADPSVLEMPRIGFYDQRINALVRMIADDIATDSPSPALYGEGLLTALTSALLAPMPEIDTTRKRGRLAPFQLRRTVDYIEQNCGRVIRLDELAELAGLSQSYFCSAFRESTGMPPHQWQMKARIERAKTMLRKCDTPLASIATQIGFADQAHLTRVFRRITGTTPGAWRREQAIVN